MASEQQAETTVTMAQAMALLLMEHRDELRKLQRDGFIKPIARDCWPLIGLVQGFARAARKAAEPQPVSAEKLAAHLGFARTFVVKLVAQGVVERRSDGKFDLDRCRDSYIRHLRAERARSPRSEADVHFSGPRRS